MQSPQSTATAQIRYSVFSELKECQSKPRWTPMASCLHTRVEADIVYFSESYFLCEQSLPSPGILFVHLSLAVISQPLCSWLPHPGHRSGATGGFFLLPAVSLQPGCGNSLPCFLTVPLRFLRTVALAIGLVNCPLCELEFVGKFGSLVTLA